MLCFGNIAYFFEYCCVLVCKSLRIVLLKEVYEMHNGWKVGVNFSCLCFNKVETVVVKCFKGKKKRIDYILKLHGGFKTVSLMYN